MKRIWISPKLFLYVADFQREKFVIGGDFDLVLDIGIDKKGGSSKTHNFNFFCI